MAIGLEGHLRARREAPHHVQVEIVGRPLDIDTTGSVAIDCRIVRVFRSTGGFHVGALVSFTLPVYMEREGMPTGPFYLPYRTFVEATHLEAYLEGTPPQCRVACEEFCVIGGASPTPVLTLEELEQFESSNKMSAKRALHRKVRFWRWFF